MFKTKKFAAIMSASLLALTVLAPTAGAQGVVNPNEGVPIQVANVDAQVSKEALIKKFKALFPGKFNYLTNNDFQLSNTGHYYYNDPTIRYELTFNKTVNNKPIYGSVTFVGDDYEIEHFYFTPSDTKEALFPGKVSKEEARDIAAKFVNKLPGGKAYKLQDEFNYSSHTVLTEPLQYTFSFARLHNDVPISDQYVHVTVLGSGEITSLSQPIQGIKDVTFDQVTNVKSKDELLANYKKALSVDLQYTFNYMVNQSTQDLVLQYRPSANILGIQATTGKWQTTTDFSTNVPAALGVKPLVAAPLPVTTKPLTIDEAKKKAEELLQTDDKNMKLLVQSAEEMDRNGTKIISVYYMYESRMGGYGGSLEFKKDTGEIIQYHNSLMDMQLEEQEQKVLSEDKAKQFAVEHLKTFTPSVLHEYAEPIDAPYIDAERGTYAFTFPKLINGIPSNAHQISVGINSAGELQYMYNSEMEVKNIPTTDGIVSKEVAKQALVEALDLELRYVRHGLNQNHYHLVYVPVYAKELYGVVDANTGELQNTTGKKLTTPIEHPTAADQLNYLVETGILDLEKLENFNADANVTKGEALEILVKSLSYFYYDMYTVENAAVDMVGGVSPDDPYFAIVERALSLGILQPEDTISTADTMTREELAVWMIRLLGLEQAAQQAHIYKLTMADASDVTAEQAGYVALAEALGLLPLENNRFQPKTDVTYAQLAIATFELAYEIAEKNNRFYYR